jgi:EmrB/QacA subfamily drug resistance transporter
MERKWWTLVAVLIGVFMLLIDVTVVNTALPAIQRDLNSSFSDLQWVVDAYSLALASTLLVSGSVADLIGRRKVFLIGLVVFSLASLGCGLAADPTVLNLMRGVQGVGGGMMFATSLALIAQAFQGRERGVALGIYGATIGAAVAIGPLVGGVLTDAIGWEAVFLVNLPIGAGALAMTLAKVSESRDPSAAGVDYGGAITLTGSLFLFVFSLVRGNDEGWGSTLIVSFLVVSALLLAAFVAIELRRDEPLFDLRLLRKPAFLGASLVAFALSASMFSMFLYLTLYLQGVLDLSPLDAGLRFLPLSVISFVVAPVAGQLSERVPVRSLLGGGMLLVSIGLLLMHGVGMGDDWTTLLAGFLVAGAGVGMVNPPLASTAIGVVEQRRSGMASGVNTTFRQIGIATGVAALGAIFQHRVASIVTDGLAGTPASGRADDFAAAVSAGAGDRVARAAPASMRDQLTALGHHAFIDAFNTLFVVSIGVALVGAIGGLLLVRSSDFVAHSAPAAPVAPADAPA